MYCIKQLYTIEQNNNLFQYYYCITIFINDRDIVLNKNNSASNPKQAHSKNHYPNKEIPGTVHICINKVCLLVR